MATKLYHTRIAAAAISATTAAAAYPALNLAIDALSRPWRATGTGATDVTIDLGTSQSLGGLLVHDVNFASATIFTSVDGSAYTNRGVMTTYANDQGRRRGIFSLDTFTGRYVRFTIASGATTDGAAYWRAGAAPVMKTAVTLAQAPNKGYGVTTVYAQTTTQLANKRTARAATGTDFDVIRWQFTRKYQDSLEILKTQLRLGAVLIDMGLPQHPHHAWPVTTYDDSHDRGYPKANSETSAVNLTEVV